MARSTKLFVLCESLSVPLTSRPTVLKALFDSNERVSAYPNVLFCRKRAGKGAW